MFNLLDRIIQALFRKLYPDIENILPTTTKTIEPQCPTEEPKPSICPAIQNILNIAREKELALAEKAAIKLVEWIREDSAKGELHKWNSYRIRSYDLDGKPFMMERHETVHLAKVLELFLPGNRIVLKGYSALSFNVKEHVDGTSTTTKYTILTEKGFQELLQESKKKSDIAIEAYVKKAVDNLKVYMSSFASVGKLFMRESVSTTISFNFIIDTDTEKDFKRIMGKYFPIENISVTKESKCRLRVQLDLTNMDKYATEPDC